MDRSPIATLSLILATSAFACSNPTETNDPEPDDESGISEDREFSVVGLAGSGSATNNANGNGGDFVCAFSGPDGTAQIVEIVSVEHVEKSTCPENPLAEDIRHIEVKTLTHLAGPQPSKSRLTLLSGRSHPETHVLFDLEPGDTAIVWSRTSRELEVVWSGLWLDPPQRADASISPIAGFPTKVADMKSEIGLRMADVGKYCPGLLTNETQQEFDDYVWYQPADCP